MESLISKKSPLLHLSLSLSLFPSPSNFHNRHPKPPPIKTLNLTATSSPINSTTSFNHISTATTTSSPSPQHSARSPASLLRLRRRRQGARQWRRVPSSPSLYALAAAQTPSILHLLETSVAWAKKSIDLDSQGIMFRLIESSQGWIGVVELFTVDCSWPRSWFCGGTIFWWGWSGGGEGGFGLDGCCGIMIAHLAVPIFAAGGPRDADDAGVVPPAEAVVGVCSGSPLEV
ncbi:unnamed protein product [Prunus armeniaca]